MPSALTDESMFRMAFRLLHFKVKRLGWHPGYHRARNIARVAARITEGRYGNRHVWMGFIDGVISGEGDFRVSQTNAMAMILVLLRKEMEFSPGHFYPCNFDSLAGEIGAGRKELRLFIEKMWKYHY